MPVITFWSNNNKTIGQSLSAAASAVMMALEHNFKVLLISADVNNFTIEKCFGTQESNEALVKTFIKKPNINFDNGIDGLLKLADSNRVTPDLIHDYTKIIFKNRLEILYPIKLSSHSDSYIEKEKKYFYEIKNIILNASRYYDQVIVDLKKGLYNSSQLDILNSSDVIVLNTDQNISTIDKMLGLKDIEKMQYKTIWNICRHDKRSKYNSKNIKREILKKQYLFETPYNVLISDASLDGNLVELLLRFKTLKEEDENKEFVKDIIELNEGIISKYQETRIK